MTSISFIIVTKGDCDNSINLCIDSIEQLSIPNYDVIIVGGETSTINRKNTSHIPFIETSDVTELNRKKNAGSRYSQKEVLVVMHDYHVFDSDWYIEFERFGTDWDICVQQVITNKANGSKRGNGWRVLPIPGYPELSECMTIPWDIDHFIPYMEIQGAYWVIKREKMLEEPLNDTLRSCEFEEKDWSRRVVPGFEGNTKGFKIVANPSCKVRLSKWKPPYPGDPNFESIERSLNWLWEEIKNGIRRPGTYLYDSKTHKVIYY